MTQKTLETLGVKVLLNEKVVDRNGKYVLKKSGQEMTASQVIWTAGFKPLNSFLDAKFLDKKGWLQVDDFRVKDPTTNYLPSETAAISCPTLETKVSPIWEPLAKASSRSWMLNKRMMPPTWKRKCARHWRLLKCM
jgi:NAD(P)H-nitrite reductase large subunit